MSRDDSPEAQVVRVAGELERLLQDLGGDGRGLLEKALSLAAYLPPETLDDVQLVARSRNSAVHKGPLDPSELTTVLEAAERAKAALEGIPPLELVDELGSWRRFVPVLQVEALVVWFAVFGLLSYGASFGIEPFITFLESLGYEKPPGFALVVTSAIALVCSGVAYGVARGLVLAIELGSWSRGALHQVAAVAVGALLVPFPAFSAPEAWEFYRSTLPFAVFGTLPWTMPAIYRLIRSALARSRSRGRPVESARA